MKQAKKTKPEHIWSLLCSTSVVDKDTNNVSVFNLVEQLNVNIDLTKIKNNKDSKIGIPVNFQLINRFAVKENKNFQLRIEMISPDNESSVLIEKDIEIAKGITSMRVRNMIGVLPLKGSGTYHFHVNVRADKNEDFSTAAIVPLGVTLNFQ